MNSEVEKNIGNAFAVVQETYNSISKLHRHFCAYDENRPYRLVVNDFLRWKSDNNCYGWAIRRFVFLFQKQQIEKLCPNGWYDSPLYVLELDFYSEPMLHFAKFEYENIPEWTSGCSPASIWAFDQPLYEGKDGAFGEVSELSGGITQITVSKPDKRKKYWGLTQIRFKEGHLTDLTSENCDDMLFSEFDKL